MENIEPELPRRVAYLFNNLKQGMLVDKPNALIRELEEEKAIKHMYVKGDVSYYKLTGLGWTHIKQATKVFGHK